MTSPLVLEIQVPPPPPPKRRKRNPCTSGLFIVTAFDTTSDGRRARYVFPAADHEATRALWRRLQALGFETGWHRAGRLPRCPDGVVDCADLEQLWRTIATTARKQLVMAWSP